MTTSLHNKNTQPTLQVLAWPGPSEKAVNPYTWLIYSPMQRDGIEIREFSPYSPRVDECDVFHIHWPERLFWGRPSRTHSLVSGLLCNRVLSAVRKVKRRGGVVVWTAHNVEPHRSFDPKRRAIWDKYFKRLRAQFDLIINMSESAKPLLLAAYPDLASKPSVIIPHPHYRTVYPPAIHKNMARRPLGIPDEAVVLCSLGGLRPNKGVAEMIEAFSSSAQDDEYLIVAGHCNHGAYLDKLRELVSDDPRIKLIHGFLSDRELSDVMSAADACLMNFVSILNSGSVMLGLSFNKPVIAPIRGSIADLAQQLGSNWLLPLEQPIRPELLRKIIDRLRVRNSSLPAQLEAFDPAAISRMTLNAYRIALGLDLAKIPEGVRA